MIPLRDTQNLRPGDVLIHPTRGGAIVDQPVPQGAWVELTERLDRSHTRLGLAELTDGWRLAVPCGLFEQSVLRPDEAATRVGDRPGEALIMLADELGKPVDRELAATWLVSRGMLAPGRAVVWWSEALSAAAAQPRCYVDAAGRVSVQAPPADPANEAPVTLRAWLRSVGHRMRFERINRLPPALRQGLLRHVLDQGDADLAAVLVRWPDTLVDDMHADLDRLLATGHRGLAVRLAQLAPTLAAPVLLGDACSHGNDGLCGDVLASLPSIRRATMMMELLVAALADREAIEAAEGVIEEQGGLMTLQEQVDPQLGMGEIHLAMPQDGRWNDALQWLRGRSADSTMEMPSLHPTPLLRETGRMLPRDLFSMSISLARALARRHAEGRSGGVRGARLHRAEWRVDLGPAEPSTPADDVRDAMRMIIDLLIGRLPAALGITDEALLAHLAGLAPDAPVDWVAVASRCLAARAELRPADGLGLWLELERAQATANLRDQAPVRPNCTLEIGHDTHIGAVKARMGQTNQDALFYHHHGPVTLLLVADGISVSTAGSGNLASALLVQAVATLWEERADSLAAASEAALLGFMTEALAEGNRAVCEAVLRLAEGDISRHIPMGTTVVMVILRAGRAWIASLGDSRVYLVGAAGTAQLTGDGNVRGDWLAAVQSGERMELEHDGAALTSYVGHFDLDDRPQALSPQTRALTLLPGEHLLLCSDGFTDFAAPGSADLSLLIQSSLRSPATVSAACRELVGAANAGGGGDNITVIAARMPG